jgi:amino acid adenylation domain-containing protein
MKKLDKKNIENILALTPLQEGMLFHYLKDPTGAQYFEQLCLELSGPIDRDCFEQAWNTVIETNEMLRTVFRWEKMEHPMQIVLKEHTLEPVYYDFTGGDSRQVRAQSEMVKTKDRNKKFHLGEVPFRITLCEYPEAKYTMIISNHHILYDGWSSGIILQEFFNTYEALSSGLTSIKPVKTRFQEFIKWQQSRDTREAEKSWRKYLRGFDTPTVFCIKQRKSIDPAASRTQTYRLEIPGEFARRLEEFVKAHRLTSAAVLYCAWGILLQKYNNSNDVVFGTTVSGRMADVPGIEDIVGLFINTVPLRVHGLPHEKILDLLQRIHQALQERTPYEYTPLVEIKKYSELSAGVPLFDSLLVIENYPLDRRLKPHEGKINILSYSSWEETNYDVTLGIAMAGNIIIDVIYDNETCAGEIIERLAHHYQNLIRNIVMEPGKTLHDIEMLPEAEKRQLLMDFNDIGPAYPEDKTLWELFSAQAAKTPANIAAVGPGEKLSPDSALQIFPPGRNGHRGTVFLAYRELSESAERLAYSLLQGGVQPGSRVGLLVDRGLGMFTGILGILNAGCTYVPLNPKAPIERIRYMLADSQAEALVTAGILAPEEEKLYGWYGKKFFLDDIPLSLAEKKSLDTGQCGLTHLLPAYIIYTSGSTGKQKGVPITHANLSPLLHWGYDVLRFDATDRWVQNLSYYFDWSVWEIFMALTTGGSLHAVSEELLLNPARYIDYMTRDKITVLHITPTHFQSLVYRGRKLASMKYLCIGAEKLSEDLAKRSFELVNEGCRVFNMYGPTEATIISAVLEIDPLSLPYYKELSSVPIGKTVGNTKLSILDWGFKLCPLYVPGELYVGGAAVAWGYLNNPELTKEKFDQDLWDYLDYHDERNRSHRSYKSYISKNLYKTGDLARWLSDGTVEFLGRIDFQLKIRGYRIEPGEIENYLLGHKEVKEALVTASQAGSEEKYLCAYIVPASVAYLDIPGPADVPGGDLVSRLRKYLSGQLPDYMIPSYFVLLDRMPLNPNGKVDMKALPEPGKTTKKVYAAPSNQIERQLVEIWVEVLGLEKDNIGVSDDFFESGGHSLKATEVLARIHKTFDIQVPLSFIFEFPTIREFAHALQQREESRYHSIAPVEDKEYYPLSSAQKRLFVLQRMAPGQTVYNISGMLHLEGNIEREVIGRCFHRLISRHESLRTSFLLMENEPVQRVHDEVDFEIEYGQVEVKVDEERFPCLEGTRGLAPLSEEPATRSSQPAEDIPGTNLSSVICHLSSGFIRPFDLARAPLMRVGLVKLLPSPAVPNSHPSGTLPTPSAPRSHPSREGRSILMVDLHHIIADGVSIELLLKDFVTLMKGKEPGPLKIRYRDYTAWQSQQSAGETIAKETKFWQEVFRDEIPVLQLPTDYPRPPVQGFEGDTLYFELTVEQTRALNRMALENGTTLFMILLALHTIFLSKLSGQEDIVVGTPAAGRIHPDLEPIMGVFINTLGIRNYPKGDLAFPAFLEEVKERTLQAFENQAYPYEDLVETVAADRREISRNPLFDSMFVLQNPGIRERKIPGLKLTPYPYNHKNSKFDLTLQAQEVEGKLMLGFEYGTKLFKPETIEGFSKYFLELVRGILKNPGNKLCRLEILPPREREQIFHQFNHDQTQYPLETVTELFHQQVVSAPYRIACVDKENYITYENLDKRASVLAKLIEEL